MKRRNLVLGVCAIVLATGSAFATNAFVVTAGYLKVRLASQTAPAFTCLTIDAASVCNQGSTTQNCIVTLSGSPVAGNYPIRVTCEGTTFQKQSNATPITTINRTDVAQVY